MSNISRSQLISEHSTLSFLCTAIYQKLNGSFLKLEHSLGDGYYLTDSQNKEISQESASQLQAEMHAILDSDAEIKFTFRERAECLEKLAQFPDKIGLIKSCSDDVIACVECQDFWDFKLETMSSDKERLKIFEIRVFKDGLLLRFASLSNPLELRKFEDPTTLYEMFREQREWAKLINCNTVSHLNDLIYKDQISDIKWVAEGLHEQKLAQIAKFLCKNFATKKIINVAGPSSSNKTTFARRLAIQLSVHKMSSITIGMDDFYKNTVDIPKESDGIQNFEDFTALNSQLLCERVHQLLKGEQVPKRSFDFTAGVGVDSTKEFLFLKDNMFLIIEGIHGLNPALLDSIGRENVTPIYVSALTPLNLDYNHRFPTSDLRLIRRIIRDFKFRGYSPRKTIMRWTSVRKGEEKNIFPFQGNAQLFFNSALVYELPVLSVFGKTLISEATIVPEDEGLSVELSNEITKEARRILSLLNFFYPASSDIVPHISCIREFIGGSDLKY